MGKRGGGGAGQVVRLQLAAHRIAIDRVFRKTTTAVKEEEECFAERKEELEGCMLVGEEPQPRGSSDCTLFEGD